MRTILCSLAVACLAGCELAESDKKDEGKQQSSGRRGNLIAPGDIQDLANGGRKQAPVPGGQNAPQVRPPDPAPGGRVAGKHGIVGRTTTEVVDFKKATAQNPNLRVVNPGQTGGEAMSLLPRAYVSATARLSVANFEHNLKIMQAQNGKFPSYEEYMNLKNQLRVDLAALPPYQMYAYKEDTGQLVILEDPAKRRE